MRSVLLFIINSILAVHGLTNYTFPTHFLFGASTASYQIEGAWNYDEKGASIWDTLTHDHCDFIDDKSNGDVAANSYMNYKEDVQMLKMMGVDFYRFSISWPRILPNGYVNSVNQYGLDYYNNLINELLRNGIQPMVTMFHWDLPQPLQDLGGVPNRFLVDIFVDYARVLFKHFGDRVKWWITFNEPAVFVTGYATAGGFAPSVNSSGIGDYLAIHTIILAHASVYHMYKQEFKGTQKGNISITLNCRWHEPSSNSSKDRDSAERAMQFYLGLHAHAIFSKTGDYPKLVKDIIANNSYKEGFLKSRLPEFTEEEIKYVQGTFDFFGLNHYTTSLTSPGYSENVPSLQNDVGVTRENNQTWMETGGKVRKVVPWGFRKILNWINREYNNPPVFVTENGVADWGEINDTLRVHYHAHYMNEMLNSIVEDGCNVIGYAAWSLIDNFEWTSGYTEKFGLIHIDYSDPSRTRTPKESSKMFAEIIRTRQIPVKYLGDYHKTIK